MSAFIVTDAHLTALVQGLVQLELIPTELATKIGRELYHENELSYAARYRDQTVTPVDEIAWKFNGVELPLDLALLYSASKCWQYQACEYDGCEQGTGWMVMDALQAAIRTTLGCNEEQVWELADDHSARNIAALDLNRNSLAWSVDRVEDLIDLERTGARP